jgi:long-chain fatty acid transport protein
MGTRRICALLLVVAAASARAQGIESNFRPYLVGGRAAGMGGAFTALADDGSGGYYNPGGLAFIRASSLSFSLNAYGVVGGRVKDALGDGHDFPYQDLNVFPVATSGIKKLGEPELETGVAKHTVFFSVFIPDGLYTDDRDQLGESANAYFSQRRNQTLWIGGGYAHRLGRVGIGVGGYVLIGTLSRFLDFDVILPGGNEFVIFSQRDDLSTVGFVGSVGVRWDVTDQLRLGVSVFSPDWGGGSRSSFLRVGYNVEGTGAGAVARQDTHLSATPSLPYRVQAGVAWEAGRWTLAADLIFLGPRHTHDNPELESETLDYQVIRHPVLNVSLGGELALGGGFALRTGFFTDFASSDATRTDVDNTSHVNHYGLSLSGGLRTEHVRTDVGFTGWWGKGTDVIPRNFTFPPTARTDAKEYGLFVFLATAYDF